MTDTNFFGLDNWMVPSKMYVEAQAEVARLTAERDALRAQIAALRKARDAWNTRQDAVAFKGLSDAIDNLIGHQKTAV